VAAILGLAALIPVPAEAHGIVGRADLPIPAWLFGWGAAVVLVFSFVALAVLWPEPKLEDHGWRPLPDPFGRVVTSPALDGALGAVGAALLVLVVWSGLAGEQVASANLAPTFVYVVFWLGLVPASVLLGDVFRLLNPWRAVGRAVAWAATKVARASLPAPLPYPERLGRWPATLGLLMFAWLELVSPNGDLPRTLAMATLVYASLTWIAMAMYGVETWTSRGEAFSVYFNLFARLSVWERRGRRVGLRAPLSGLADLVPLPGTVAVVAVMIGSVTFDGLSSGALWQRIVPAVQRPVEGLGLGAEQAVPLVYGAGLVGCAVLAAAFYRLGVSGMHTVERALSGSRLAGAFVHSLVPIALVYAAAHYVSLLFFQGQAMAYLVSDPLGLGWDLFGTASTGIDYGLVSATTFWYVQVGLVVAGHVAGLVLAHDRALALFDRASVAVRSQYWMLGVMIGFTTLALWLLAAANAGG
jgi:hypothetical protein